MRITCLLLAGMLAVSAASAGTTDLTIANLAANGWKTTAASVYGGAANAAITETADQGVGNFRFFTGSMPVSWQFQWGGLSTDAFAGTRLADITSVRIRNLGVTGDNFSNWQPPTFSWIVNKGDGNQRCIIWLPWSNGNPREAEVWHEYDAAITGQWHVYETGAYYNSLAELQAALPDASFESTTNMPVEWGYPSQQAFNVGNCPLYDEDRARFSGVVGYVDWFEIGVGSSVTRYDLGAPALAVRKAEAGIIVLSWSTNAAAFHLLGGTNLNVLSATWNEVTNARTIVGDQVCVTNTVSAPGQFYRLSDTPGQ